MKKLFIILIILSLFPIGYILYNEAQFTYTGEYFNGKYHGYGILEYPSGDTYKGEFKEDKAHGKGTFYFNNGEILEGIWENNELIKPTEIKFSDGETYSVVSEDSINL